MQIRMVAILDLKGLKQSYTFQEVVMRTHVGIELSDKTREIVVLEVIWEQISSKLRRAPHHKSGTILSPRHYVIGNRVVHQVVSLR